MSKLIVIAVIVAAVVALGIWGLSGARDAGTTPAAAPPAAAATGWTTEARTQLRAEVARHNAGSWPAFLTTDDARSQMLDCFVGKIVAAVPGGVPEWNRVASDEKRLQALTAGAGFECGREYSDRITSATSWSASFPPVLVASCVQGGGEELRGACACIADGAPARFKSPVEFMGVLTAPRAKRQPADQARLDEVLGKCGERAAAIEALGAQGFAK